MTAKKIDGFTLIETLVSLAILGVVLTVSVSAFLTVLTRSTKVQVVRAIESDGQYALRIVEEMVKRAERVLTNFDGQDCEEAMNYLRIKNADGGITEFSCLDEGLVSGFIASSSGGALGGEDRRLTSPMVRLDDCYFDCSSGGVDKPDQIGIYFTLSQSGDTSRVNEQAASVFQSAVTLRNY